MPTSSTQQPAPPPPAPDRTAGDSDDYGSAGYRRNVLAIIMSSLTTAGGMLSFVSAGLLPIRDIGLFVPFGVLTAAFMALVLLAFVFDVFLSPALLALVYRNRQPRAYEGPAPPARIVQGTGSSSLSC